MKTFFKRTLAARLFLTSLGIVACVQPQTVSAQVHSQPPSGGWDHSTPNSWQAPNSASPLPPIVSGASVNASNSYPWSTSMNGEAVNRDSLPPIISGSQNNNPSTGQWSNSPSPATKQNMLRPIELPPVSSAKVDFDRSHDGALVMPTHSQTFLSKPTPANMGQRGQTVSTSGVPFYSNHSRARQDDQIHQPTVPDPATVQSPMPRVGTPTEPFVTGDTATYFDHYSGDSVITTSDSFVGYNGGVVDCPSCGPSGCFDPHSIDERLGYFGAMTKARRYGELDALYVQRTDGTIVLSNGGGLGRFDGEFGWRITMGERHDAIHGREFSYFGTADISKTINRTDPFGRLSALFTPSSVIGFGLADPFFNAQVQNETMETKLHSVEFNRVWWGWDVVKSIVGIRYIYVDDSYEMFSQRGGIPATYELESLNNLIGVHIGRELFYDVGYRLSFSAMGKAGLYANANRFEVNATNSGTSFLNNRTDSSTFSTSLELMLTAHYQINRRARLRFGYQGLLLDDIYSVSDNLTGNFSPFQGSREPDKDSMYFHGINVGLELYR